MRINSISYFDFKGSSLFLSLSVNTYLNDGYFPFHFSVWDHYSTLFQTTQVIQAFVFNETIAYFL